jgi:hypothetical protein
MPAVANVGESEQMCEATCEATVEIGGMPILVRTTSLKFYQILHQRYGGYLSNTEPPAAAVFDVDLVPPQRISDTSSDQDLSVRLEAGRWVMERGDFLAVWDPASGRGTIRQSANPYSIDAAFRIVHSLLLAQQGGLLVHAASAVRNGRAFLFAGVSTAGKTTISRLAPPDATLLTDEISYLRRNPDGSGYTAYGTPFAGELAEPGVNVRAPLAGVFLLAKGPENVIEPVTPPQALRGLMESILFFAHDADLVNKVFDSALDLVSKVPVERLTFYPDKRVWDLIQ